MVNGFNRFNIDLTILFEAYVMTYITSGYLAWRLLPLDHRRRVNDRLFVAVRKEAIVCPSLKANVALFLREIFDQGIDLTWPDARCILLL